MGAAVGACLRAAGHEVLWASEGRSPETALRAADAGLTDAGSVEALARRSDVILSICPPHAALDVAAASSGFDGLFVDANAVSPETARAVAARAESGGATPVDGGIVGPPPRRAGTTRLYLSGEAAGEAAALFEGSAVAAVVLSEEIGSASTLKMAYASWTKGTTALLLAARAVARAGGVEASLLEEWAASIPELPAESLSAAGSAATKGWRWVAEMEEIAATFGAAGLPDGFHLAAAEVFRRSPRDPSAPADEATLDRILDAVRAQTQPA